MSIAEPAAERNWRNLFWSWALLLTMGAAWGLSFSIARIGASLGAHPLGMTFWEAAIAGLALVILAVYRRRPITYSGKLLRYNVITGVLGMVIPGTAFFYAASRLPAGVLSLTVSVVPILTYIAALALRLETVSWRRLAGVVLGTLAMVFLVTPDDSLPDPAQLPWVFAGLAAAVCYAVLGIYSSRNAPTDTDTVAQTAGMFVAATIILVPIVAVAGAYVPFGWPWGTLEWSLFGVGMLNAVGWGLFFVLLERAGPVFSSFTANVVTLCGVLWGIVIFAEINSSWVWLSLATISVALVW